MINIQPIEKLEVGDGYLIKVHSIFHTIQGEGPFCGQRAVFVRLAGCNLQCPSCDTEYTGSGVVEMSYDRIVEDVRILSQPKGHMSWFGPNGTETDLVVITGGEPFRQNIVKLCNNLVSGGRRVQIETNGTLPPPINLDKRVVIVCSPKTNKVNAEIAERATCFKYIMSYDSVGEDGLPANVLGNPSKVFRPPKGKPIYLQPADAQDEITNAKNLQVCVDSCMKYGYTLQLQIHKLIGVE